MHSKQIYIILSKKSHAPANKTPAAAKKNERKKQKKTHKKNALGRRYL